MPHRGGEVVQDFIDKLNARARHVIFFLGAGASASGNLPNLADLKIHVAAALAAPSQAYFNTLGAGRNLEEILTRLRIIYEAVSNTTETLDGLTAQQARDLDRENCRTIATILTTTVVDFSHHDRFARWTGRSQYDRPIEIATSNYDVLVERALERVGTPYFDGFVGTFSGEFRGDLVDDETAQPDLRLPSRWVRVWKLHGSVSWTNENRDGRNVIVRTGSPALPDPDRVVAIYPSFQKYEESRRLPFVALADRLRRSLAIPETLVVTCGYSFGDQHINELLYDAARHFPRSEVTATFFNNIPQDVIARALELPNLTALGAETAVIGGTQEGWEVPQDPAEWWQNDRFALGDFRVLAALLARRIPAAPAVPPGVA
jgi:SIR2-like protein